MGSNVDEGLNAAALATRTARTDRSVAFVTMGCAKNEVDSEQMRKRALAAGYSVAEDPEFASAVVVNTCSFIQVATEESIEAIFDVAGLPNVEAGHTALIVAGCMPARYGDDLEAELSEASAFVPCSKEDDIVAVLDAALSALPAETLATDSTARESEAAEGAAGADSDADTADALPVCGEADSKDAPPDGAMISQRTFAYVKISDGCDRFCSYCTIPFIRGRYRSFPLDDIRRDVEEHVAAGAREIVLIAQDTGRWGRDFPEKSSLAQLVSALAEEFPDTWFRVMYLQPEGITDELLDAVASHGNVCSYFDIPLQHVDASILRAMNRHGSREKFAALAERIRAKIPEACLRTTLIAGFPGETEEQFEDLCDFVEEGLFDYAGVFAYSREEGTRAFDLPGQVDEETKAERAQRLRDTADAACAPVIAARIGQTVHVLVEGVEEDGQIVGRAMCQAPEVDGATYLDRGAAGDIVSARIVDTLMYEMEGEVL